MVDTEDFIYKIDTKNRKTKRFRLTCNSCHVDRGYGMKTRANSLCKKCMTKNSHLEECTAIAREQGGKLLSTVWQGSTAKYEFECREGHRWNTYSYVVRRGSWCPTCSNNEMASNKRKKNISYCEQLATSRDGKFLSTAYTNDATKYSWSCKENHIWSARLSAVEIGSWCPQCFAENSRFRRKESVLRSIVEDIFDNQFPSTRPDWLINPETGYRLELDCYCEALKLAFEYDGELHDKDVDFFNNSSEQQRKRDIIKDTLCSKMGVKLIRITHHSKNNLRKAIIEATNGIF